MLKHFLPVTQSTSPARWMLVQLQPPTRSLQEGTVSCQRFSLEPWEESARWSTPSWVHWPLTSGLLWARTSVLIAFTVSVSGHVSRCFKGPMCKIPNLSNTDALGREFGPPPTESVSIWQAGFPSLSNTDKLRIKPKNKQFLWSGPLVWIMVCHVRKGWWKHQSLKELPQFHTKSLGWCKVS